MPRLAPVEGPQPIPIAFHPVLERIARFGWRHRGHPSAATFGLPPRLLVRGLRRQPLLEQRWIWDYEQMKESAIASTLDDPGLMERFGAGAQLPRGFGFGIDERVVELPWGIATLSGGDVLDAGSALNHEPVLTRVMPRVASLTISTFTTEDTFDHLQPRYVTADLRALPFDDDSFDAVLSISTLEHVGMDNSAYGSDEPPSDDPNRELDAALSELLRVLRPGGEMRITVPYGRAENQGWLRQFDRSGVEWISHRLGGEVAVTIYRHSYRGWQRSNLLRAANARYRDPRGRRHPTDDCTFAAEAVACLALRTPR